MKDHASQLVSWLRHQNYKGCKNITGNGMRLPKWRGWGVQMLPQSSSVTLFFFIPKMGIMILSTSTFFPPIECDNGKIIAFIITHSSFYHNLVCALSHSTDCFHQGYHHPFVDNSIPLLLSSIWHCLPGLPP